MGAIYSIDAHSITPEQAVKYFANEYWPKPREVEYFRGGIFGMVDGYATYQIILIPEKKFESPPLYQIFRLEEGSYLDELKKLKEYGEDVQNFLDEGGTIEQIRDAANKRKENG